MSSALGRLAAWWRGAASSAVVAAGMVLSVVVVGAVCGFLIIGRGSQATQQLRDEASMRAATAYQLLTGITEPQTQAQATALADAPSLRNAVGAGDATARADQVAALFELGSAAVLPGTRAVVFDASAKVVYTNECGAGASVDFCESQPGPHVSSTLPSVALALAEGAKPTCAASAASGAAAPAGCPAGFEGLEVVGGTVPVFDAAVPVWNGGNQFLGVVLCSTTMQAQFHRYGAALGDTPALLTLAAPGTLYRFDPTSGYAVQRTAIPSQVGTAATAHAAHLDGQYTSPAGTDVAAGFDAVGGPDGKLAGYVGVEVATSTFGAQTAADQRAIGLIGVLIVVLVFVVLATLGPRLAPGTAAGSRGADADERRRLRDAMLAAARGLAGTDGAVSLFDVADGRLRDVVAAPHGGLAALGHQEVAQVLAGQPVRRDAYDEDPALLLVPAISGGQVVAAVAAWSPVELTDREALALAALAAGLAPAFEAVDAPLS